MERKTLYTEAIADEICQRLAEGEPLRVICRDAHMPAWRTVYLWMRQRTDFAERVAEARKIGYDAIAEEALEIADTPVIGEEIEHDGRKVKRRRSDMLGHRKLQVWTRLQLLARWYPTKYGERTAMEVTGAAGGPVQIDDTDRAVKLAGLLALAAKRKGAEQKAPDDGGDDGAADPESDGPV
jgi:hypothetical protein